MRRPGGIEPHRPTLVKSQALEASDARGIELASTRRKENGDLADDGRLHDDPASALGDRVDLETGPIRPGVVLGPGAGGAVRTAIVLGHPLDFHLHRLPVDGSTLDGPAEEITFSSVLDLQVATNEFGQSGCGQLHINLPTYVSG